jgi:peptide/nickel transport system permease protein
LQAATLAIAFVWWPSYARITRSVTLSIRHQPYLEAAKVIGMRDIRIIFRHVLPNASSPLIVKLTMDVGYAILLTASLGFLGLGAQEPTPEWGRMVAAGRSYILDAWWYSTFPGLAIFLAVLGFTWLGDGLRDWLDPQVRRQRA